jgi:hypothetical protein
VKYGIIIVLILFSNCLSYNDSNTNTIAHVPWVDTRPNFNMIGFFRENFESYTRTRYRFQINELGLNFKHEMRVLSRDQDNRAVWKENIFVSNGFRDGSRYIHAYWINDNFAYLTFEWYHGFNISNDSEVLELGRTARNFEDLINSVYKTTNSFLSTYFLEEFIIEQGVIPNTAQFDRSLAHMIRSMILNEHFISVWYDDKENEIYNLILKPRTFFLVLIPENSQIHRDNINIITMIQDRF